MNSGSPGIDRPGFGPDTLLIGIGNDGRADDGLGWAFLDRVQQEMEFPGQLEYRYQLQVEDAALIRGVNRVVFIDSYQGALPGGFLWEPCAASAEFEFTSHVLPPCAVLHLCRELNGKTPRADLLLIEGSSWDLHTGLSSKAQLHLGKALQFFGELKDTGHT